MWQDHINATIVTSALPIHHIGGNMNVFIQERNLTNASIVLSSLVSYQIASDMNVHILE